MKKFLESDLDNECPEPSSFKEKIHVVVFISWLFFITFIGRTIFAPLMPELESELNIGHAEAGRLFFMISLGYITVPFISGLITSKFNHRGAMAISVWIIAVALFPIFFLKNSVALQACMFLLGIGSGMHMPSAMSTIAAEVQKSDWGKALSLHQCVPPFTFFFAPLIGGMMLQIMQWRQVVFVWAVIALVSAICYSLFGRGGTFPGRVLDLKRAREVLRLPAFWMMLVLLAMGIGCNAGLYAMLPLYFVHERGMELAMANSYLGLSLISGIAGVFAAGWIIDRIGPKRTMIIILLISAVCIILLAVTSGMMMLFLLFVEAAAVSAFFPAAFGAFARIAPPSLRSVTTAMGPPLSFVLGAGVVPAAIGMLGDLWSFSVGIVVLGCFVLTGPLLVFPLKLGQFDNQQGC